MSAETIVWKKTADELPDDDTLVLFVDYCGDVESGIMSSGKWYCAYDLDLEVSAPDWWADMPAAPSTLSEAV